jgi:hypothetical protein
MLTDAEEIDAHLTSENRLLDYIPNDLGVRK